MYVQALVEGVEQGLVAAQVGHDAQLNLAVVGAGNHPARRGDEGLANAPPLGRAHGDVLQIGLVAGQPPRHGHGLRVVGVHAPGARQGHVGQLVGVGVFQLGQAAVLQNFGGQGVVVGQFFQHLFVGTAPAGGRFFHHGHAQLVKKDFAQLLGAGQVERLPGQFIRRLLQRDDARTQVVALARQLLCINRHAVALHAQQRLAGGHLQGINVLQPRLCLNLRPQHAVHVQGLVGIFAGVGAGLVQRHLGKGDLVFAFAAQVFVAQAGAARVAQRQAFQAVRAVDFQHIALQHGVVLVAAHGDAVVGQHVLVVLDMLAQLGLAGILQPGLELGQHVGQRQLLHGIQTFVAQRNVGRFARLHAQRNADQLRLQGVEAVGLGVDGGQFCGMDFGQPFVQLRLGLNAVVGHFALLGGHGHFGAGGIAAVKAAEQVVAAGAGSFFFRSFKRSCQAFKAIFIVKMAQIKRIQLLFF